MGQRRKDRPDKLRRNWGEEPRPGFYAGGYKTRSRIPQSVLCFLTPSPPTFDFKSFVGGGGVRGQYIRYAPTKCARGALWPFPYRAARSRRHFLATPQMFISCLYCGVAAHGAAHDEPRYGKAPGRTGGRGPVQKKIYLYRGVTGAGSRPPSSNKKFCFCTWTGGASPV